MEHSRDSDSLIAFVRERGVARSRDLTAAGFSRVTLTRLVNRGELLRLAKGIYCTPDHDLTQWHDLAELSRSIPSAVVTLISALAFHEIGTQLPYELWIALPEGSREPTYHQSLRVTRFAEPYYSAGVETHDVEGVPVRVYSAAKTVADCFKMRSKVGYDVAIEALREGWQLRKFTLEELNKFAKLNRVQRVMHPYIEAITS